MIEKIKKYKKVIYDLFFNTLAFGIYIVAQQFLLMPIMARTFPEEKFSIIVIYMSIYAIITNVLGSELGIVRQIKNEETTETSDYNRILLQILPIVLIISIISLAILKFSIVEIIILTIAIILGNIRLYSAAYFRLKKDFKYVLVLNLLYLIGITIGALLTYKIKLIWLPMILAEILCLIFYLWKTDLLKSSIKKTENNKNIIKTFRDLGFISFLINMTTYFDKIIIYPILGDNAVSVYYATSSMSKILGLIVNPLHGVIISWLKGNDEKFKSKVVKITLKVNIPILIIVFILSLPLTYLAVRILYPQYLGNAMVIILPICIGAAFNTVATLVKAILMKYVESKKMVHIYVSYIAILIVLAIFMSNLYGIVGFAYSTAISKIALWILFILTLNKVSKQNILNEGEESEKE